ncbi:TolC family protein, partial [Oscillibacter sp. UBA6647]
MKRTFALLLAALLTMAAALPVLADDRVQSSAEPTASSSSGTDGAETAMGTDALPAASSGQTDAASPDASASGQTGDAAPAASVDVLIGSSVQSAPLTAENTADTLHFENLRKAMEKYNGTIISLQGQIRDLSNSPAQMGTALDDLLLLENNLRNAVNSVDPGETNLFLALQGAYAALSMQTTSMMSQYRSIGDSTEAAKNTLNDAINQMVKGAETLYMSVAAMQDGLEVMNRSLDSLNRAVAIVEKQQELGMASTYDVEKVRYQRSQLKGQMETLKYQIVSNKVTLEGMCGMELRGSVNLGELSVPSQVELDAVSYDKMLSTAMDRNVDVMNAQITYTSDTSADNKKAYAGAKSTFAAKFKGVCMAVPENVRLVSAA